MARMLDVGLVHLASVGELRELDLRRITSPTDGVEWLKRTPPGCKVGTR